MLGLVFGSLSALSVSFIYLLFLLTYKCEGRAHAFSLVCALKVKLNTQNQRGCVVAHSSEPILSSKHVYQGTLVRSFHAHHDFFWSGKKCHSKMNKNAYVHNATMAALPLSATWFATVEHKRLAKAKWSLSSS